VIEAPLIIKERPLNAELFSVLIRPILWYRSIGLVLVAALVPTLFAGANPPHPQVSLNPGRGTPLCAP